MDFFNDVFYVLRADLAEGVNVSGGCYVTVESGPHLGLQQACAFLQSTCPAQGYEVVFLPLEAEVYAIDAPVNDKPCMLVSAQTLHSAFGANRTLPGRLQERADPSQLLTEKASGPLQEVETQARQNSPRNGVSKPYYAYYVLQLLPDVLESPERKSCVALESGPYRDLVTACTQASQYTGGASTNLVRLPTCIQQWPLPGGPNRQVVRVPITSPTGYQANASQEHRDTHDSEGHRQKWSNTRSALQEPIWSQQQAPVAGERRVKSTSSRLMPDPACCHSQEQLSQLQQSQGELCQAQKTQGQVNQHQQLVQPRLGQEGITQQPSQDVETEANNTLGHAMPGQASRKSQPGSQQLCAAKHRTQANLPTEKNVDQREGVGAQQHGANSALDTSGSCRLTAGSTQSLSGCHVADGIRCATPPIGRLPRPDVLLSGAKLLSHSALHSQALHRGSSRGSDAVSSRSPAADKSDQCLAAKLTQVCTEGMDAPLNTATCQLSTADEIERVDTANSAMQARMVAAVADSSCSVVAGSDTVCSEVQMQSGSPGCADKTAGNIRAKEQFRLKLRVLCQNATSGSVPSPIALGQHSAAVKDMTEGGADLLSSRSMLNGVKRSYSPIHASSGKRRTKSKLSHVGDWAPWVLASQCVLCKVCHEDCEVHKTSHCAIYITMFAAAMVISL